MGLLPVLARTLVRRSAFASSTMYAPTRSFTSTLLARQAKPISTPPPSMTAPPPTPQPEPVKEEDIHPESLSTPAAPPPLSSSPEAADGDAPPAPTPASFDLPPQTGKKITLGSLDLDMAALPPPKEEGKEDAPPAVKPLPNMFEQKWFQIAFPLGLLGGAITIAVTETDMEERQKMGLKAEDPEPSAVERFKFRTSRLFSWAKSEITEPIWTELLPGKIPPERPYTLLVDLEGILTCSKWDSAHGWRTAKRPGADYFIAYLSQFYEVVLFTTQPAMNAAPIAEKLDPYAAYMPYRLYRDATRFEPLATAEHGPNAVIKDLAYLNRPLNTVVMLDTDKTHVSKNKSNAIIVPKWDGTGNDKGLVELIPFLESIGIYEPKDVRPILAAYEDKDVVAEYAKVETARREIEYRNWAQTASGRRALANYKPVDPNAPAPTASSSSSSSGFLSSISGLFAPPSQYPKPTSSTPTKPGPPPSYLDQRRAQAQMMYGEEQKYWAQNKDEIERLQAEDRERQMEEFGKTPLGTVVNAPSAAVEYVKSLSPFSAAVKEEAKEVGKEAKAKGKEVLGEVKEKAGEVKRVVEGK